MGAEAELDKKRLGLDVIALIVAILALVVSGLSVYWTLFRSGELVVHEPATFCIVRGYNDEGFPSDFLVVPVVIDNTGNGTKAFYAPTLSLVEKNTGKKLTYSLAGFLPDTYAATMDKGYEIGFGAHVPGNSVRPYALVFHIEDWWDDKNSEYFNFNFKSGQEWDVSLDYFLGHQAEAWHDGADKVFFTMPIYGTIDRMKYGGGYNSDCFSPKQKGAS